MANNERNLPIDSHMSPRVPIPLSQQQMIDECERKRQEEIQAIFLLHTRQEDRHSSPCSKPHMNHHHILANHELTSHQSPSKIQSQMPHSCPQLTGYYPYVRIPPPMPPMYVHNMPSLVPCLPQQLTPTFMATTVTPVPIVSGTVPPINYMAVGFEFSGSNTSIHNNIVALGVMSPWQVPPEAQHNTFNTYCHMNMIDYTYDVGGASTSNVAAQGGGVSFHCPYNNLSVTSQFSSMPPMVNSSISSTTSILLPYHILPEVEDHTISITYASGAANGINDPDNAVDAGDDQQHQEQETTASHDLNVHGNFCAEVATGIDENNYDIYWDEYEIGTLLEDFMINDDQVPLYNTTSTGDLP